MKNEFVDALGQIAREKNLPVEQIFEFIESGLAAAYRRDFLSPTSLAQIEVNIDRKTGEVAVFSRKTVVKKVEDDLLQVSLKEAQKMADEIEDLFGKKTDVVPLRSIKPQYLQFVQKDIIYA